MREVHKSWRRNKKIINNKEEIRVGVCVWYEETALLPCESLAHETQKGSRQTLYN
jgi:hypothetical protein